MTCGTIRDPGRRLVRRISGHISPAGTGSGGRPDHRLAKPRYQGCNGTGHGRRDSPGTGSGHIPGRTRIISYAFFLQHERGIHIV
jgi:hypothetical protein